MQHEITFEDPLDEYDLSDPAQNKFVGATWDSWIEKHGLGHLMADNPHMLITFLLEDYAAHCADARDSFPSRIAT